MVFILLLNIKIIQVIVSVTIKLNFYGELFLLQHFFFLLLIYNKIFRQRHEISLKGKNIPAPIQYFSDYNFPTHITDEIRRQNFEYPTAIQAQGWPIALSGRDLVGIAKVNLTRVIILIYYRF